MDYVLLSTYSEDAGKIFLRNPVSLYHIKGRHSTDSIFDTQRT